MSKIIKLTEKDINTIVQKVLKEEQQPLNEFLGLTAAILAYRQTAKSKAARLTRKIKTNLRQRGIKNSTIQEGKLKDLMKCINGEIENLEVKGDKTSGEVKFGKSKVSKSLTKRPGQVFDSALDEFKKDLKPKIALCCSHFNIDDEDVQVIYDVIVATIVDFSEQKVRI